MNFSLSSRYIGWFKKMDSISYVYISWTIHGIWMIYITFERGPKFSNTTAIALAAQPCSSVTSEQNGYYAAQDFLRTWVHKNWVGDCCAACVSSSFQHSTCGIWKFRTSSFKCYVDHSHTMYSSGNTDVRNWVHLFESPCIQLTINRLT